MTALADSPLQRLYLAKLDEWSDIRGHMEFIYDLVLAEHAQVVVELGVRWGTSTAAFLAAVEATHGHLWSVDTQLSAAPAVLWQSGLWTFVQGDDLEVADRVPDEIDICFIDTLHHYEHTGKELRLYGPRSRILLLHDTELEHPHGAPRSDPPYPVREALIDYLAETGRNVEWRSGSYGMAVVR